MAATGAQSNFHDLTNVYRRNISSTGLPTPPSERKRVRQLEFDVRDKKRLKFNVSIQEHHSSDDERGSISYSGDEGVMTIKRYSIWDLQRQMMLMGPARTPRPMSTTYILESFVSSHKADIFKCHSIDESTFVTIPYACAYSHAAKRGGILHLAVATEQGTVHVMDTSKRRDWDPEPARTTLQPHANGIFDVKWSPSDDFLATASGDKSVRVVSSGRGDSQMLHILRGHESTVKCVAWDSTSDGTILCAGARDGSICLWDLRVGEGHREYPGEEWKDTERAPVLTIPKAHEDTSGPKPKRRSRKITAATPFKGITSVVYSATHPYGIISSNAFDGILHLWDVRQPIAKSKNSTKTKVRPTPLFTSSCDPTTYGGTRRARGITTLAHGVGPTGSYIYALGTDSRVHTYSALDLEPLSGHTSIADIDHDPCAHTHASMQTNSFYVKLAMSPCGRWLASGNAADGLAYLFDVAGRVSAARARNISAGLDKWDVAVELRGQTIGEVGAMDWADGALAMCGDDGTVRVWRPDPEVSRRCAESPEEMKWEWSWASDLKC